MTIERFLHEVLCNSLIQAAREWDLNEAHAYYLAAAASYQLLEKASERASAINTARYLVQTKYLGDVTEAVKSNCLIRFDKRVRDLEQTADGFFIAVLGNRQKRSLLARYDRQMVECFSTQDASYILAKRIKCSAQEFFSRSNASLVDVIGPIKKEPSRKVSRDIRMIEREKYDKAMRDKRTRSPDKYGSEKLD
jgi:hypothetical protein